MKKIGTYPTFIISLLLCTISFAQEQAPAPVHHDGDFWQFKVTEKGFAGYSSEAGDGTYELVYSQGDVKISRLIGDGKKELDRKPSFPIQSLVGLSKEREDLRFPLMVGQKWDYQYKFTPRGAKSENRVSTEISVKSSEDVTTSAGTFRSFRLHKDESWPTKSGARARQVTTYFYSPQTRSIVKSSMESDDGAKREVELLKFGSAIQK